LSWLASVIVSHSLALRHSDWVQRWFPLKDSSHGQAHELLCSLFPKVVLWTLQSALQHHMLASELLSTSQQFSEPSIPFGPQYHPRGFLRPSSKASTVLKSLIQLGPCLCFLLRNVVAATNVEDVVDCRESISISCDLTRKRTCAVTLDPETALFIAARLCSADTRWVGATTRRWVRVLRWTWRRNGDGCNSSGDDEKLHNCGRERRSI
jgi:hypothetical protein